MFDTLRQLDAVCELKVIFSGENVRNAFGSICAENLLSVRKHKFNI